LSGTRVYHIRRLRRLWKILASSPALHLLTGAGV
jgi:hypothetical protein